MEEVRAWVNEIDLPAKIRSQPGVKDVEFSFCEWLVALDRDPPCRIACQ